MMLRMILMVLLVIVMIVSDSAQLVAGRRFGRYRVAPSLSPNKTLEGYVGGLAASLAYGVAVHGWPVGDLLHVARPSQETA